MSAPRNSRYQLGSKTFACNTGFVRKSGLVANVFGVALGLSLLSPQLAQAQQARLDDFGAYGDSGAHRESDQDMAFEVRFGPYIPDVDAEFDGAATPFADVFGDKNRYMLGAEVDWQALRIPYLGTLGPGVGIGYTKLTGFAFDENGDRSKQETNFGILPMYAVGVLRIDTLVRQTPIPLAGYVKAGLGAAMWWTNDGEDASKVNGEIGRDLSYGYQLALGGMLLLDFFDDESARELDVSTGINNSYFFFEWYKSNLDGFGSGKQMQVGAETWFLGLAFEL